MKVIAPLGRDSQKPSGVACLPIRVQGSRVESEGPCHLLVQWVGCEKMSAFSERDDFDLGCHERGLLMELLLKGLCAGRRRAYAKLCVCELEPRGGR